MPAIAITTIWWTVNGNMIIYLAGLQEISRQDLYEAARIDGAGRWQETRYVTIPMLMPVNAFVIPLTVIACWRVFGQAWVMTRGGPQGTTFTIAQYIYQIAFQDFRMGLASAAGVILDAHHSELHCHSAARHESDLGGSNGGKLAHRPHLPRRLPQLWSPGALCHHDLRRHHLGRALPVDVRHFNQAG